MERTIEDAKRNRKYLSCTWMDIPKAYDSVSHNWLIRILEMHGLERTVINIIEKIVKTWETTIEVTTCNGRETANPISIKRRIRPRRFILRHAVYREPEPHCLVPAKHRGL